MESRMPNWGECTAEFLGYIFLTYSKTATATTTKQGPGFKKCLNGNQMQFCLNIQDKDQANLKLLHY